MHKALTESTTQSIGLFAQGESVLSDVRGIHMKVEKLQEGRHCHVHLKGLYAGNNECCLPAS